MIQHARTVQRRIIQIFEFIDLRGAQWFEGFLDLLGRMAGLDNVRQTISARNESGAVDAP